MTIRKFENERASAPDSKLMKNIDSSTHTRGESIYLDDIPEISGTLYAAAFDSQIAHGIIKKLDCSEAEKSKGVSYSYR